MTNKKLIGRAALNALGVLLYIALIGSGIRVMDHFFSNTPDPIFAPMLFLSLFVFSALVTGSLILMKPVMLYLDGEKKAAVRLLLYTIGWLFVGFLIYLALVLISITAR